MFQFPGIILQRYIYKHFCNFQGNTYRAFAIYNLLLNVIYKLLPLKKNITIIGLSVVKNGCSKTEEQRKHPPSSHHPVPGSISPSLPQDHQVSLLNELLGWIHCQAVTVCSCANFGLQHKHCWYLPPGVNLYIIIMIFIFLFAGD